MTVERLYSAELIERGKIGGEYVLAGWVERIRDMGAVKFLSVRDREGHFQVVVKRGEVPEPVYEMVQDLGKEDVVYIEGELKGNPIAPGGRELSPRKLVVLNKSERPLPLEFRDEGVRSWLDTRLNWRNLDLRNRRIASIFKLESEVAHAMREYFRSRGFIEVFTPKLVGAATESGAEVFKTSYFGREAVLAQSPQFYKQMMMATGFDKVFEIGPVFRAEKHHTPRHLCEYHSVDFEKAFIEGYEDVMRETEGLTRHYLNYVKENCQEYLELSGVSVSIPREIPRISMRDAYRLLKRKGKEIPYGDDLDPEGERILSKVVREEYDSELFFLTEFPWGKRPFYTMRNEDEPDWTYSFDLIHAGLEIVTGGQREHRYETLVKQCREKGFDPRDFEFYLNFFKHGMPPHGGVGIGLERVTQQILGLENIRETRLLPRDPERLFP
ncbi:MAG: aspartate--tRNA(Asn) ligase [Candidatus Geothermarchaeales archaeon]